MRVTLKGKQLSEEQFLDNILEIVTTMAKRMGLPDDILFCIENVSFTVAFDIDGKPQYATVPREINGKKINEMFEVIAEMDEDGNIKETTDNEEESFVDGYSLAKAAGEEYKYEGIKSKYKDTELEPISELKVEDGARAVKYNIKAEPDKELVRHYKEDKIVAEYVLLKK